MRERDTQRETLPEKLAREIMRVAVLREQLCALEASERARQDARPRLELRPMLLRTGSALALAITAAGSGDVTQQLAALKQLQGFRA